MQSIRITATGVVHATNQFVVRGARLVHTAGATAQIRDGATREITRLAVVADPLYDDWEPSGSIAINGLDVVLSAGVLFVYVD